MTQGDIDGAEALYREALRIDRKIYGNDHLDVGTDLNNLALLLWQKVNKYLDFIFGFTPLSGQQ